jgi:hypothetical protein
MEKSGNKPGLGCHKISKTPPLSLEQPLHDFKAFLPDQHDCTLLQYIHDLLLAGPTWKNCMKGICLLLSLLWEAGYKFSWKKTQICQNTVKYLSFHLL